MSILTDTAPKRIFLCISDEPDDYDKPYPELYAEDAEITWSTDTPVAVTVEYVREDLSEIAKLRAERDALAALLQKLRGAVRLYRGGGVAGQQMGNESYSILVTGHTLGDIDAALAKDKQ